MKPARRPKAAVTTQSKAAVAMRPTITALVVCVALWACTPVFAQGQAAARVNGAAISQEEVDRQFDEILRENQVNIARLQDPDKAKAFKRDALERLIAVELMWQEAKRTSLVADDGAVVRALDAARQQHGSHEAFVDGLRRRGHDEASHRQHIHRMLSADRYAQYVVQRDVRVEEREVVAFYAANPRHFKQPERVRARHILVAVPAGADRGVKAKARARIDGLLARVRAGEDFDALARQHSDDATRSWGGELDVFVRGQQPNRSKMPPSRSPLGPCQA